MESQSWLNKIGITVALLGGAILTMLLIVITGYKEPKL